MSQTEAHTASGRSTFQGLGGPWSDGFGGTRYLDAGLDAAGNGHHYWPSARLADIVSCVGSRTHHQVPGI